MTREYNRYNAGLTRALRPQRQRAAVCGIRLHERQEPSGDRAVGSVREQQPAHGRRQLSDQLHQSAAECAGAEHHLHARTDRRRCGDPGIAGGVGEREHRPPQHRGRRTPSDYEHTNYRGVAGVKGEIGPAWRYDAYGQYYYVQFYNTNNRYLNFARSRTRSRSRPARAAFPSASAARRAFPTTSSRDGGVTQDALNYLYTDGTGYGRTRCARCTPISRATSASTA